MTCVFISNYKRLQTFKNGFTAVNEQVAQKYIKDITGIPVTYSWLQLGKSNHETDSIK